jgi:hypothetical protein
VVAIPRKLALSEMLLRGHKGKVAGHGAAHPASHAAAHTLTPMPLMPLIYMSG